MTKSLLKSLIPWLLFFILFSYDQYRMQIGAIGALLALLILSRRNLHKGIVFDWLTILFFLFVVVSIFLVTHSWLAINAELIANIVLTVIAWTSLLLNKPFTLEYTKRSVAKEYWQTMLFSRINLYLTVLWSVTFTALTILSVLYYYNVGDDAWTGEILPIILILLTIWMTVWFPDWCKREELGRGGLIILQGLSDLYQIPLTNASFSYRTIGHGMPLIMLPASYMSMYSWDPELISRLSRRYQVILIDYPGIGESRLEKPITEVQTLAVLLKEFVLALGLKKSIFVGYALGGWVTQWLAIQEPHLVEGLVLISSDTGGSRAASIPQEKIKILHDRSGSMVEQNERLIEMLFPKLVVLDYQEKMYDILRATELVHKTSPVLIDQQDQIMEQWYKNGGTYSRLADIHAPCLVIVGGLDTIIHRQNSLLLKNGIQQAKLLEFADAGHGVIYQYPNPIADAIIQFFKTPV